MTFLLRTLKYGLQDFWRNFWLSLITITVIFIAVFCFNSLIMVKTVSDFTLETIETKIDIAVFINPGVEESVIMDMRARILGMEEVKDVTYISAEEALQLMRDEHKDDPTIIASLDELGDNPLGAQLIVKAHHAEDYDVIMTVLKEPQYKLIIGESSFEEHTSIIEKIASITGRIRTIALVLTVFFSLVALIVVYNTLRVIIYTHRQEIGIMSLVGATKWFIRMPYIWQSLFYALLAMGIFLLIWYPLLGFIQPYINELFADATTFDLVQFYNTNFVYLYGLELLALVVLLSLASILATSKYSKV